MPEPKPPKKGAKLECIDGGPWLRKGGVYVVREVFVDPTDGFCLIDVGAPVGHLYGLARFRRDRGRQPDAHHRD